MSEHGTRLKEAASTGGGPIMPWSISSVEHFIHSSPFHLERSKAVQSLEGQSHKTQSDPAGWQHSRDHSAHGYGDIDAQIAIVCKQLGNGGVKHQAVGVHDGRADSLMDRSEITSFNPTLKKTLCYLGVASQVRRRLWPFSSNLGKYMG